MLLKLACENRSGYLRCFWGVGGGLHLLCLVAGVKQAQFACVVSVKSPFVKDFQGKFKSLVIELVKLLNRDAGCTLQCKHQSGNDLRGRVAGVGFDEFARLLDRKHVGSFRR